MPTIPHDPSDIPRAICELKKAIDRLTEDQTDALKLAIYVGITPDEAKEYDDRRKAIMGIAEQLKNISGAQ